MARAVQSSAAMTTDLSIEQNAFVTFRERPEFVLRVHGLLYGVASGHVVFPSHVTMRAPPRARILGNREVLMVEDLEVEVDSRDHPWPELKPHFSFEAPVEDLVTVLAPADAERWQRQRLDLLEWGLGRIRAAGDDAGEASVVRGWRVVLGGLPWQALLIRWTIGTGSHWEALAHGPNGALGTVTGASPEAAVGAAAAALGGGPVLKPGERFIRSGR